MKIVYVPNQSDNYAYVMIDDATKRGCDSMRGILADHQRLR